MTTKTLLAALLVSVCARAPASANPRDVAIHVTRLGGDSATAQPYIDRFLRYLETAVGWPSGSTKGSFLATRKEAMAFISGTRPGIAIVELPLYLEIRKSENLQPILQIESRELVSKKLHVVVRDPAIKTLADLKGKRVWTMLADYPRYLSRVVLDGKADAADLTLKQIGQALKGVRGLLRGDCDATILDDEQLSSARGMTGGGELRVIHTSPTLPSIPVALFGTTLPASDRESLTRVLTAMCGTDKGGAVCKEMRIDRFAPVDRAVFEDVQKRYGD